MPVYALQGSMENRSERAGPSGSGVSLDLMFTLNTADRHAVAVIASGSSRNTDAAPPATENATAPHAKGCASAKEPTVGVAKDAGGQLSMFSSEAPPANPSAWQDSERDWTIRVVGSSLPTLPLLAAIAPAGWSGRTSPVSCRQTEDGRLEACSEGWQNSGMGSPTAFLTLSTSAWPSDGSACSLSAILETGDVPQRFYLSGRACRGILRRAEKRGKDLPTALRSALTNVAAREATS